MFKTGSKFLYGLAAFGFVAAVLYAIATGDQKIGMDSILGPITLGYKGYVGEHVGYSVLMGLAAASLFLAIFLSVIRDADPEAGAAALGLETVPEVPAPVRPNYWPLVGAFSAACLVAGLALGSWLFVLGLVGVIITVVEWAVSAWADRATGDPAVNASIRGRLMHPVEIPVGAVLGIVLLVFLVSRILLALPKGGYYAVFIVVPAIILAFGFLFVMRPKLSQSTIAGILLIGGIAVLVGGVAAAIAGEHKSGEKKESGSEESGLAPLPAPGDTVIRVTN